MMVGMKRVQLQDGQDLVIRKAMPDDASDIIAYIDQISTETNNLTFGPGSLAFRRNRKSNSSKASCNQITS